MLGDATRSKEMRIFGTFSEYLHDLTSKYRPGEMSLTDERGERNPHALLQQLDHIELACYVVGNDSSSDGRIITIRPAERTPGGEHRFTVRWSKMRSGWSHPYGPGRTIHCFVPREWINYTEHLNPGLLISLCKRSVFTEWYPFETPSDYSICKRCQQRYDEWFNAQNPNPRDA